MLEMGEYYLLKVSLIKKSIIIIIMSFINIMTITMMRIMSKPIQAESGHDIFLLLP